jgi:hypothetical protein
MIPFVAVVSLGNQQSRRFRWWIPVVLIWLLLLPLTVLLSPLVFIACLIGRVNPFRAVAVMGEIVWALHDTRLEVEHRNASMSFHILWE